MPEGESTDNSKVDAVQPPGHPEHIESDIFANLPPIDVRALNGLERSSPTHDSEVMSHQNKAPGTGETDNVREMIDTIMRDSQVAAPIPKSAPSMTQFNESIYGQAIDRGAVGGSKVKQGRLRSLAHKVYSSFRHMGNRIKNVFRPHSKITVH